MSDVADRCFERAMKHPIRRAHAVGQKLYLRFKKTLDREMELNADAIAEYIAIRKNDPNFDANSHVENDRKWNEHFAGVFVKSERLWDAYCKVHARAMARLSMIREKNQKIRDMARKEHG